MTWQEVVKQFYTLLKNKKKKFKEGRKKQKTPHGKPKSR